MKSDNSKNLIRINSNHTSNSHSKKNERNVELELFSPTCKSYCKTTTIILASGAWAILYYPISDSGCTTLKKVLNLKSHTWNQYFFATSIITCIYRFSNYSLMLHEYNLWPTKNKILTCFLISFALIASTTYFTAGEDGAKSENLPQSFVDIAGYGDLAIRIISSVHGCNKFSQHINDLLMEIKDAFYERNWQIIAKLVITFFTAAGYSFFAANSIYAALNNFAFSFGASESAEFEMPSYILSIIGAIGTFPVVFYWVYRGIKELTNISEQEQDTNNNSFDRYTLLALLFNSFVVPGTVGSSASESALQGKVTGAAIAPYGLVPASLNTLFYGIPSVSNMFRKISPYISAGASWTWSKVCTFSSYSIY